MSLLDKLSAVPRTSVREEFMETDDRGVESAIITRLPFVPKIFVPKVVWTGSFNFTINAGRSLVAAAYAHEWSQVAALSEPLDWASEWMAPEYRLGT